MFGVATRATASSSNRVGMSPFQVFVCRQMKSSEARASFSGVLRAKIFTRYSGVSFKSAVESSGATSRGTPEVKTVRAAAMLDLMFHSGSGAEPGA